MLCGPPIGPIIQISDDTARKIAEELLPIPGADPDDVASLDDFDDALTDSRDRYRILHRLATGGMGVVYEAEQVHPKRAVALKVMRTEFVTEELLSRFRREADVLGTLRHPGIAQIFDAGVFETPGGPQPYLSMELIRGRPITEYARRHGLTTSERLALFITLCDAVDHIHTAGVVHRDLKPANVLVDDAGDLRVIDFGIASIRDPGVEQTIATASGQLLGTIQYMSPEQTGVDGDDPDERSDAYSLGVILFELLTDVLPYEVDKRRLLDSLHMIREEEATRLSSLGRRFRGDLDTIVAKSLEKSPDRRYQRAADLALDVQRFLDGMPIEARRPSRLYRSTKFVKRHRVVVASVAALVLALSAGIVGTSVQAIEATRARNLAEARALEIASGATRTEAISDFLTTMLISADPWRRDGRDVRVVDVIAQAEAGLSERLREQPGIEAEIRELFASLYNNLGLLDESRSNVERAIFLYEGILPEDDPRLLHARGNLGTVLLGQGDLARAEPLLRDWINAFTDPDDPDSLHARSMLGLLLLKHGRLEEAAVVIESTLEDERRVLGPTHEQTIQSMNSWAGLLGSQGKVEEAETVQRDLVAISADALGARHPLTLDAKYNLAYFLVQQGNLAAGCAMLIDLLDDFERVHGSEHPFTLELREAIEICNSRLGTPE